MEAPEKIIIGKSNITSDGDVVFAWVTRNTDCEAMQHNIEYIRTDVFTEKACKWLEKKIICYSKQEYKELMAQFKNYIQDESEN